jgi:hypothetical protein
VRRDGNYWRGLVRDSGGGFVLWSTQSAFRESDILAAKLKAYLVWICGELTEPHYEVLIEDCDFGPRYRGAARKRIDGFGGFHRHDELEDDNYDRVGAGTGGSLCGPGGSRPGGSRRGTGCPGAEHD